MHTKAIATITSFLMLALISDARAERRLAAAANEGICAELADATSGLESLCINYCEARDCPNSDDPECDELLANYDRHRRDGDPDMPCLTTCPCFTAEQLNEIPVELTQCIQDTIGDFTFSAIFDDSEVNGAAVASRPGAHDCVYSDFLAHPPIVIFGGFALDPEEAAICLALVDAAIADRGLVCRPIDPL